MNFARRFVRALSYFTILPVRSSESSPEPADVALLPVVGALVGFTAGTIAYGASRAFAPRVGAAFALGLPIVLTGALHLDGFLDICDAAFASVDADRRREILRDPRHGSYAFAGGALATVVSYAALREVDPHDWPSALALAESVARYAALIVARKADNGAGEGTAARAFAMPADDRALLVQGAALLVCAQAYGGLRLSSAALAIIATSIPIGGALARRFGGTLSGDGYGFTIVLANVAMLCALA